MPYSIVHSEIAFGVRDFLKYHSEKDFLEFLVGNIFVDSSHMLCELGYDIERDTTHYYTCYEQDDFPEIFWEQEGIKNPFFIGYYFHLLTDKIWRDSPFLSFAYDDINEQREYQVSRKLHSFYDFLSLTNDAKKKDLIDKLYSFSFSGLAIPSVFANIPLGDLDKTLYGMLDYMLGKKIFIKKTEKEEDYSIEEGVFTIKNLELQKKVEKKYPYEEYNSLKKQALDEFQVQVSSKIS